MASQDGTIESEHDLLDYPPYNFNFYCLSRDTTYSLSFPKQCKGKLQDIRAVYVRQTRQCNKAHEYRSQIGE
jgi:hypothetical protein